MILFVYRDNFIPSHEGLRIIANTVFNALLSGDAST